MSTPDPYSVLHSLPAVVYTAKARFSEGKLIIDELTYVSDWIEKLTGWSVEDIRENELWWYENVHEEDRERAVSECRALKEGASHLTRSYRFRKKDGDYIYLVDSVLVTDVGEDTIDIIGVWEDASFHRQYYELYSAIDKSPHVGLIIYTDTIVYANEVALKLFNYSSEELFRMNVYDLVTEEFRDFTYETVQRRLRGEQFERVYVDLPVVTKEGYVREVSVFTKTIQWQGKPAGFVLFFDVTGKKRYERLFRVLKDLNELIITTVDREVLLERLCEILVNKAGFRSVWLGLVENGKVVPRLIKGEETDYIRSLGNSVSLDRGSSVHPIVLAVKSGRVVVNPDTRTNPLVEPWREEMLESGYYSSCVIPVFFGDEVFAVIGIYSHTPNTFTEEEIEVLKDIQLDISFALDRIEKDKLMKIVSTAVAKGHEWVLITNEDGEILYTNKAVEEISGYSADELIGKRPNVFKSGYHDKYFYKRLWSTIKRGESFSGVMINRKKDGSVFYLDLSIIPVEFGNEGILFVALGKDITSQKRLEETLSRIRFVDVVTDLPNRNGFFSIVQTIIDREPERKHALLLIDIRDFRTINQVYGSSVGDEILRAIAKVLSRSLFERDIVGRIGPDEFGIFAKGIRENDVTLVVEKILRQLSEPIQAGKKSINIDINLGASIYPEDGRTARELFEKASLALSIAREEGENRYRLFSNEINSMVVDYFDSRRSLEQAFREDRFFLNYQPIYETRSGRLVGFESLLRLRDTDGSVRLPGEFISVLERTGLIGMVEDRMLMRVRDFILRAGGRVYVSTNISPRSFKDERFIKKVEEVSREVGENLILEITERLLVEDPDYTREFLSRVRTAGVKVTVDDFGTGYSSLAYLESLPVDILKIDMEFVRKMTTSEKTFAIVETIVDLARRLGLLTIAEGVETHEQLNILKGLGCDMVQGFYLSRPVEEEKALGLLV